MWVFLFVHSSLTSDVDACAGEARNVEWRANELGKAWVWESWDGDSWTPYFEHRRCVGERLDAANVGVPVSKWPRPD